MAKLTILYLYVVWGSAFARSGLDLWKAAYKGNITKVEMELAAGADPNWQNKEYEMMGVLHIAAQMNRPNVVRKLLKSGADMYLQVVGAGCAAIFYASGRDSHSDVITAFLDYGINVDTASVDGCTPLMLAANNGALYNVKLLLAANASVDLQDFGYKQTALHCAAAHNYPEVVHFLLKMGANPFIEDAENRTVLDIAKEHKSQKIENILEGYMTTNPKARPLIIATVQPTVPMTEEDFTTKITTERSPKNLTLSKVFKEITMAEEDFLTKILKLLNSIRRELGFEE